MKFDKLEKHYKALVYILLVRDNKIALTENLPNNTCRFLEATIAEMTRAIKRWGFNCPKEINWDKDLDIPLIPGYISEEQKKIIKDFYDSFDYDCSRIKDLFVK